MQARVVMLVDLDYFYAQCEELRKPSLKNKPVVVGVYSGRTEESGAVSTANYIAREYGVKSGMPLYQAKKKLEAVDSVFLPVDDQYYEQISANVMNLLRGFADEFEQVGIDEAYLDVTARTQENFRSARDLAVRIRSELKAKLKLTCSIGVGPNKLIAKIAADQNKPDDLTVIQPHQVSSFLEPLPVKRLIGVGVKTAEKMKSMNIQTIGDLARFDGQRHVAAFGRALGTYFYSASHGIDNEPVQEKGEAESISRIATLKQDTNDINIIFEKTDQLCSDLHQTIMEKQVSYKTVSIIAIATDLTTHTRAKTFENPSTSLELMKQTTRGLFERLQAETTREIRRVGVKVSSLAPIEKHQKQITRFIEDTRT